ncbi:hypothetical protein ABTP70_19570, partial [Acinetobacter baumannii]
RCGRRGAQAWTDSRSHSRRSSPLALVLARPGVCGAHRHAPGPEAESREHPATREASQHPV